ncbi:MAG: peptidoglycan-binding domain-containing protein [Terricaulis sp.]
MDGYDGENVHKAVAAYQTARGLTVTGVADASVLATLAREDASQALSAYVITAADVRGPFAPVPRDSASDG